MKNNEVACPGTRAADGLSMHESTSWTSPTPALERPRYAPRRKHWALASVAFCLLALLYTFPLVLSLRSATLQLGPNYAAMANARIIGEQLSSGSSPLETDRILAPSAYTIHEGFLPSLMVYLLGFGRDFILGLNLSVLFSFVLAALGAWALAFSLTGSTVGSLAGGVFYGFRAAHYTNLPLYPVAHIEWIPWHLYAQILYFRSGRRNFLVIGAISLIAASLSSWYFAVFLLLAGWVITLFFVWSTRRWRRGVSYLVWSGLAFLLLAPFTPLALLGRSGLDAGGFRFIIDGSADLLSVILPP